MRTSSAVSFPILIAFAILVGIAGCGRKNLGDDYELVTEFAGSRFLVRNVEPGGEILICSNISRFAYDRAYIVGWKEKLKPERARPVYPCHWENIGYFIVTKETAEVEFELAEDEFLDRCTELGIDVCQKIVE